MITLADIDAQIQALQAEKQSIVEDAKARVTQLEVAERALQVLAAPLRKSQFEHEQARLIQIQSACRPEIL